ncbi:MAG: KamA family radical SAM protein [Lachnospiraceae bacterium]|nr:KamA family radical SAM protein [Lachnospiraceae bacterium]
MKNKQRDMQLQSYTCNFVNAQKDIPVGTNHLQTILAKKQQEKILNLFHADENLWNNWHWQINNRICSVQTLSQILPLSDNEIQCIKKVESYFRWAISPYYISLINPQNPQDPIRKIAIPDIKELSADGEFDPMDEAGHNPTGAITRRYPDRLIINVTNACGSYCRHCQRRRNIGTQDFVTGQDKIAQSIQYIKEHTEIRDVLITGGDPLTLEDDVLIKIVAEIRSIPHVEIIRIGTRMPVVVPQRITEDLVNGLKQYHPIYINMQFNHPQEITPQSTYACNLLADNGFVLGNQMVLLNGINDDKYVVQLLNQNLLKIRIRPYYIFHAKNIIGTTHFRTSIQTGLDIMKHLRGNTSGLAIPTYVLNAPRGAGKIPLNYRNYQELSDGNILFETWEGKKIILSKDGSLVNE